MHHRPENKFEQKLCYELNRRGWSTDHCESVTRAGWPDITALRGVHAILIETKKDSGIRESQRILAREMWIKHGVVVFTAKVTGDGWFILGTVCDKIEFGQALFSSISDLVDAILGWLKL